MLPATSVYVADYRGLDVQSVNALRQKIHVEGRGDYEYRVTKNSVLRRAAADSDVAAISDRFRGPTAIALSYGDPVGLAKILTDFAKDHEVFALKAGVLDGRAIAPAEIGKLALTAGVPQAVVDKFTTNVSGKSWRTFAPYVSALTAQASVDLGASYGTPTVLINGTAFKGDLYSAGPLTQAIVAAKG